MALPSVQCFVTMLKLGLLESVEAVAENQQQMQWEFVLQAMYEVAFYVLLNVLFLNLILGVIVDSFFKLREKEHDDEIKLRTSQLAERLALSGVCRSREVSFAVSHVAHLTPVWVCVYHCASLLHLRSREPRL